MPEEARLLKDLSPKNQVQRTRAITGVSGHSGGLGERSFGNMSQYLIVIRGNNLAGATEEALHFAYLFLSRALQEHRRAGKNGEYEAFAVEVLALLQKYRALYTTPPEPPQPG